MAGAQVEKSVGLGAHAASTSPARRAVDGVLLAACVAALAVALVFAGLLACLAPVTTRMLAQATSRDDLALYTRDELVELACATRDYTVGSHSAEALLAAEAAALDAARADGRLGAVPAVAETPAALGAAGFADLSTGDLRAAFAELPDTLVLPADAVAHLDDCYAVVRVALPVLVCVALAAVLLAAACAARGGRRRLGLVLALAGGLVLAVFAALGAWALLDFQSLFAAFHGLFFQEGTWKFPWDSLLICMYPTAFWTGMVAVWAATTALCAAVCVAAGAVLRRQGR